MFVCRICLILLSLCFSNRFICRAEVSPVLHGKNILNDSNRLIFPVKENSTYLLVSDFDLKGHVFTIPPGVTIKQKNGVIRNGTLVGNGTMIEAKSALFENVRIKGDWNVPKISTDLFVDLSYDNALREVVALTSSKVQNEVRINEGVYVFALTQKEESGIVPASNTKLQIEATLSLKPNDLKDYCIVNIKGDNIHVFGDGVIEGDKSAHIGKVGGWGMGVNFDASNSSLSGLTIKNCWGDCVYIGRHSKNCSVSNCILDNGRRQGISITSGENIRISDCKISNVSGKNPGFAICIEPNKRDTIKNVLIKNVIVDSCVGGVLVSSGNKNGYVESVDFLKCKINSVGPKGQLKFIKCHDIKVLECNFGGGHLKYDVIMRESDGVDFTGNTFYGCQYVLNTILGVSFQKNIIYCGDIYPNNAKTILNDKIKDNLKIEEKFFETLQ